MIVNENSSINNHHDIGDITRWSPSTRDSCVNTISQHTSEK